MGAVCVWWCGRCAYRYVRAVFYQASSFNGDLSSWDTSSVTDMSSSECMAVYGAGVLLAHALSVFWLSLPCSHLDRAMWCIAACPH